MKSTGTHHKTFTRTYHLILYLVLVIVFAFLSCRFAKGSGTGYGDAGDSIRYYLSDINRELMNRLAYANRFTAVNSSIFYTEEAVNEDIILENLHYFFKKAIKPVGEQPLRLESWMLTLMCQTSKPKS